MTSMSLEKNDNFATEPHLSSKQYLYDNASQKVLLFIRLTYFILREVGFDGSLFGLIKLYS
jgi:hypothetical protein